MSELGIFIKPTEAIYPGYRGGDGFVQNLSSYRENVRWFEPGEVERDDTLQLDIERHVRWDRNLNLLPYEYSAMARASYPRFSKIREILGLPFGPTREKFDEMVQQLSGFVRDERLSQEKTGLWYRNASLGILVDWNLEHYRRHVSVAAVHYEKVATLDELLERVFPNIVTLFNKINPTRELDPDVVEKTIALAREEDVIHPRCRIPLEERH